MENTVNDETHTDMGTEPQSQPQSEGITYGMKLVGIGFNPYGDNDVARAKMQCANLIDQMNALRERSTSQEQKCLAAIAITELQGAQMWAVKAITWQD